MLKRILTLSQGEARGRNGWFQPKEIEVQTGCYDTSLISIEVWSQKRGDMSPVFLALPPADATALAQMLLETAAEHEKKSDEGCV